MINVDDANGQTTIEFQMTTDLNDLMQELRAVMRFLEKCGFSAVFVVSDNKPGVNTFDSRVGNLLACWGQVKWMEGQIDEYFRIIARQRIMENMPKTLPPVAGQPRDAKLHFGRG